MWEFRWYEPGDGGERRRRTMIVGTANQYSSESAARKAPPVQAVLFRINRKHPKAEVAVPTVGTVVSRYEQEELPERYCTRAMYQSLIETMWSQGGGRFWLTPSNRSQWRNGCGT
jgi:hypothetical protein